MTPLDLSIPFGLGLVSSLHCAQMCGPLVLAYSAPLERTGKRISWPHLAYNAGRLFTYSLLGALAGTMGGGMVSLGRLTGLERTVSLIAGTAMVIAAVLLFMPRSSLVRIGSGVPAVFSRTAARLLKSASPASKLTLGAVMGFLPCGMVYAALIKAVDAGSALAGALTMLAFGAGTAGMLLSIGLFSSAITARLGRYANTLAAVSILLVGAFLIWRGWNAPMRFHHHG